MKNFSKSAAYLGDRKPSLPEAGSHQAKGGDYVYSPDDYVLGEFSSAPEIHIKKTRHSPSKKSSKNTKSHLD